MKKIIKLKLKLSACFIFVKHILNQYTQQSTIFTVMLIYLNVGKIGDSHIPWYYTEKGGGGCQMWLGREGHGSDNIQQIWVVEIVLRKPKTRTPGSPDRMRK